MYNHFYKVVIILVDFFQSGQLLGRPIGVLRGGLAPSSILIESPWLAKPDEKII